MNIRKLLLLDRIFRPKKTHTDSKKTVEPPEPCPRKGSAARYNGWKFELLYKSEARLGVVAFTLKTDATDSIKISDEHRDHFKALIASVYKQIDSNLNDYINVDDTLIINKKQFISVVLVHQDQ